jgi:hypothetical protein
MKKWLSYRDGDVLGRPLTTDEAREFTDTGRRLAAIVPLQQALDERYAAVSCGVVPWLALLAPSRADVLFLLQRGQPALTLV